MYSAPCFKFPSKDQIDIISKKWKLALTPDELDIYYDIVTDKLGAIAQLSKMQEPVLEVKYLRTPGRPPTDEENPLKAWCWICDIEGAPCGPLAGRTVAIKDSIALAGVPMACGSSTLGGYIPHYDATVVTRILNAGVAYGPRGFYPTCQLDALIKDNKTMAKDLPPTVKVMTMAGAYLQEEYGGRFYAKSQNMARVLKQAYNDALVKYDVLVLPTLTGPVRKLRGGDLTAKDVAEYAWKFQENVCQFNMTDHPVISINAGFLHGLPVGMQIVGRQFDDAGVLQVAYGYECLRDGAKR